jgi:F0F1-type ATP synthase membrane subunit b/b'
MNASSIYLVLAEAGVGAPQAHEQQLLDVDGTVLLQFGLFLIAMYALTQLLWKPYLRIRTERGARVEGFKEEAKRMDADAAARFAKVEAQLAEARRVGSLERARVRIAASAREQEIISAAQAREQQTLLEARARVEKAMAGERASLAARAELLGHQAAEKVLGRGIAR